MPRYHFKTDGSGHEPEDGVDLPDVRAAKRQAVQLLTELLRNAWDEWEHSQVTVTDERGLTLFMFQISETAAPVSAPPPAWVSRP